MNIVEDVYEPKNRFSTFGISDKLVRTIASLGMEHPSPIQDQIIPYILEDRDVIGLAQTGTGKTAAFLIPLIDKTLRSQGRQTLILTPTRELAIQIEDELRGLSKNSGIYSAVCVGGANIRPQIQALRKKNHFVIGTPGRILDLIEQRKLSLEKMTTVVLDEADRMLDMGFIHDVRKILSNAPKKRETLLFSATMSDATKKIVQEFLKDPVMVSVKKKDVTDSIEQNVVHYADDDKFKTLTSLLSNPDFKRVLVFGAMKHSVEKLARQLGEHGVKAESIHGNKNQSQRQRSLKAFKSGQARVLVATDVAARGIHVDEISHVINYDLPNTFEDYVHRIGRTGRADKRGKALTFVSKK
ncbi:MAG: DEAD/DEAH box helicase [Candidatus Paceibacterota bacterium]